MEKIKKRKTNGGRAEKEQNGRLRYYVCDNLFISVRL